VPQDHFRKAQQDFLALRGARSPSCPCETRRGSADRPVDVLLVAGGNPRQQFAGGGIYGVEGGTRSGVEVTPVDEGLSAELSVRRARARKSSRLLRS